MDVMASRGPIRFLLESTEYHLSSNVVEWTLRTMTYEYDCVGRYANVEEL